LDEALAIARGIRSEWIKSSALNSVALALNQQGHLEESASVMQESRAFAQGIKDDYYKSGVLKEIAVSLSKLGQVQESLVIARGLSVENDKESVLREIAIVLIEQGNYSKVEAVILEITQIAQRQDAWKDIAKTRVKTGGWQNALEQVEIFKTEEAKLFYLKGWAENVKLTDVNDICIQQALPIIGSDNSSTENLLQKYAVNLVVMGKPSRELTDRLNRTLNIQWALDIAAQFPIAETKSRLSTNLESWLHEIADEDDREQIELWAKQVAKGKITEEEFEIKIKDLN
jgi:hypothetical protein